MVELSQSFSDMPARRAAASALSRTNGSMPSTLRDTREFMLSSGSESGAACAFSLPARPREETIEFRAGRLPLAPTFSCYGKELVKELGRAPLKLPGRRRRADPGRSGRPCRTGAERISNLGAVLEWPGAAGHPLFSRWLSSRGWTLVLVEMDDKRSSASSHHSATTRS